MTFTSAHLSNLLPPNNKTYETHYVYLYGLVNTALLAKTTLCTFGLRHGIRCRFAIFFSGACGAAVLLRSGACGAALFGASGACGAALFGLSGACGAAEFSGARSPQMPAAEIEGGGCLGEK